MTRRLGVLITLGALFLVVGFRLRNPEPNATLHDHSSPPKLTSAGETLGGHARTPDFRTLPLSFETNGVARSTIPFVAHGLGYSMFISAGQAVLATPAGSFSGAADVVTLQWVGSSPKATLRGLGVQQGSSNYYLGQDRARWQTRVPHFARVEASDLYPGVDLVYYGSQRDIEFDLTAKPGSDPGSIRLRFAGARSIDLKASGDLSIATPGGEIELRQPRVYQIEHARRRPISGRYRLLSSNEIALDVPSYRRDLPLVIDPVLTYAMRFGGTGFSNDVATSVAIDSAGDAYVAGVTCAPDYPVTPNAVQPNGGTAVNNSFNCKDGFVTKVNSTATSLIYSTYFGGTAIDAVSAIAVDGTGAAYITGGTQSTDFPTTVGAFKTSYAGGALCQSPIFRGCTNAFFSKLSPTGALVYSTYLGGSSVDFGLAIAVDSSDNAYIVGATNSSDFPTSSTAVQKALGGGTCNSAVCFDAFVTKMAANGTPPIYSTYLGGNDDDFAAGIAVDGNHNAYIAGGTGSTNFPVTASGFQRARAGTTDQTDGFMAKLNATGSQLLYSTYFGGSETDYATRLTIDGSGNAYIVGATGSADFPVSTGALQTSYAGPATITCSFSVSNLDTAACGDVFVAKLNPAASGAASRIWATYLGGTFDEVGLDVAVNSSGQVWVVGDEHSTNFPTTADAYAASSSANTGPFVSQISADGTKLLYSTLLIAPNNGNGVATGVVVDSQNNPYIAGTARVSPTPGVYPANLSTSSANQDFLAKFTGTAPPMVHLSTTTLSFTSPVGSTSAAQTVTLSNTGKASLQLSVSADFVNFFETNNCGAVLAAAASCSISVTFKPSIAGSLAGRITISDNAPGAPHQVSLSGNATTPASTAILTPSLVNFGNQGILSTSPAQVLKLTNKSTTTALTVNSITVPAPFTRTTTCGGSLAASSSCSISVRFSPGVAGPDSATLTVSDNAAGGKQTTTLLGSGISGPAVFLQPSSLTFPVQAAGTTSSPKTVTLRNTGNATLDLTGFLVRGEFVETSTCTPTTMLAPGAVCSFSVVYKPTENGPHQGTLEFSDNGPNSPQTVPLSGLGPVFFGPGSAVNFPNTTVGSSSTIAKTVTNGGNAPLHLTSIVIGGLNPGDFALGTGTTCKNGTVLSVLGTTGSTCKLNLVFKPMATGARHGTITFTDDAAGSPQVTDLNGTGQ